MGEHKGKEIRFTVPQNVSKDAFKALMQHTLEAIKNWGDWAPGEPVDVVVMPKSMEADLVKLMLLSGAHVGKAGPVLNWAVGLIGANVVPHENTPESIQKSLLILGLAEHACISLSREFEGVDYKWNDDGSVRFFVGEDRWVDFGKEEVDGWAVGSEWEGKIVEVIQKAADALRPMVVLAT